MDDIDPGFKILAALVVAYLIPGILYESYIHPTTIRSAGVCHGAFARWGRSSDPNHDAHPDAHGPVKQAAE